MLIGSKEPHKAVMCIGTFMLLALLEFLGQYKKLVNSKKCLSKSPFFLN